MVTPVNEFLMQSVGYRLIPTFKAESTENYIMKIVIFGGGSFGTALAGQLAENPKNKITILLRDKQVRDAINEHHVNTQYFPGRPLQSQIQASCNFEIIRLADILLLCVPTKSIPDNIRNLEKNLTAETLVVNLAKGLLDDGQSIVEYFKAQTGHADMISMKGASFSAEMVNNLPTLFTVGFERKHQLAKILEMAKDTSIFLDFTNDIRGVEVLSALKNIYAIAIGNVDARYNALNTRFMILTKAVEEIKIILRNMGGREETIFLCCGIGDIALTGLSDLSRNRTLGLLIGKGFYSPSLSDNLVVLEGSNTLKIIDETLSANLKKRLPLFGKIKRLLAHPESSYYDFHALFRKKYKTVLTYGTYDLLHFGHLEMLRRVREMGDRVIVGLSTEAFNREKGKKSVMSYEKRKHLLEVLRYVDLVIPEESWDQKIEDVKNYDVDVFVMGSDWKGKFDFLKPYCEVRYIPRTDGISTTKVKSILKQ